MADKSINELPVSPGMTDDALLVVYQNGETESIEGSLIKGYARDAVKQYVDGAAKSAGEAAESAKKAGESAAESKKNADQTAADVVVVKSAADAERERVAAEEARKAAETSRETEEGKRVTSEEERKTSETTRQESEEGRESAETERVSNETSRGTAEERRATSEAQRVESETTRVTAETTRQEEEGKRATAEENRAEEEAKRAAEEATRATEEGKRATAETGRETAEEGRETAETDRVEAEKLRAAANTALSVWEPYDPTKTYQPLNKVAYNGSSYICTAMTTGHVPTNAAYWLMIAAKGQDGEGVGDMLVSTYDPQGKAQDVFAYADEAEANAKAVSVPLTQKGTADGVATLGADGKVPTVQLPVMDYVPTSRKVNNKALTADVTLTALDVGALPTTGGTMTGALNMGGQGVIDIDGLKFLDSSTATIQFGVDMVILDKGGRGYLNFEASTTGFYGAANMNGNPIRSLCAPTYPTDAANKQYVDEKGAGGLKQFGPLNLTIPVGSWSGSGPYTQNVAVSGVKSAWDWRLKLSLQKQSVTDTRKAQEKAMGCVTYCDTYEGGITLTCYEKKPEVNILAVLSGEV